MKIIKIPAINGLGKTKGTEDGPEKIVEEGEKIPIDIDNVEEQERKIYEFVKKIEGKVIFIGGDHSISYPITKAIFENNKDMKMIILDAHPDLMPPMQNPTHEEWLRASIINGIKEKDIMLIGIRNIDKVEKNNKINKILIKDIKNSREKIEEFVGDSPVYLSIDIDFFDKSVAPATGYPEDNGAKKQEGLKLIREILEISKVKWADIVEVNPHLKGAEKTILLAKEILETLKNGIK